MDSKTNFVFTAGVVAYLCMPIILSITFEQRGYFHVGGEWFIPILVMALAYALYVNKESLEKAGIIALAVAWLGITNRYRKARGLK